MCELPCLPRRPLKVSARLAGFGNRSEKRAQGASNERNGASAYHGHGKLLDGRRNCGSARSERLDNVYGPSATEMRPQQSQPHRGLRTTEPKRNRLRFLLPVL